MSKRAEVIYRNAALALRRECGELVRRCIHQMRKKGCAPIVPGNDYAAATELLLAHYEEEVENLFARWRIQRLTFEPLFSMPPARRKSEPTGKPLTLVERRAVAARKKVIEWQRKQKLAATKIKAYRRKVAYYTKKGVIS